MPVFPLPTLAATVAPTGITAPVFADIMQSLQASFKAIYGSDAYIDPDSQDGQWIAIFARAMDDANKMAIAVYNNYSPATAVGTGLSAAVKMNGITRNVATQSTISVQCVGQAGTVITNGIVSDANDEHQWALPGVVTIPIAGQITVVATCADLGSIDAAVGTLTSIVTPTRGWQTCTNTTQATLGAPVESDAALRRRQGTAAAQASVNNVGAMISNLSQITSVTDAKIHENYTGVVDSAGVPAHSIAAVIVGGAAATIASTLALTKSPGCSTFGTTSVLTTDPNGLPITVQFSRPVNELVDVVVNVKALAGWSTTVLAAIQTNVAAMINGLGIGQGLVFNNLWSPANLVGLVGQGTFQITTMTVNAGTADIAAAYNQDIVCNSVTVNAS